MGYANAVERRGFGVSLQNGVMVVLAGLSLVAISFACAAMIFLQRKDVRRRPRPAEKRRDEALKGTFPASDTPASQYFDIPVNRL